MVGRTVSDESDRLGLIRSKSIYSLGLLPREAGGRTKRVPSASITWSRFNGSAALPRNTLSLRTPQDGATRWLPTNKIKLD